MSDTQTLRGLATISFLASLLTSNAQDMLKGDTGYEQ